MSIDQICSQIIQFILINSKMLLLFSLLFFSNILYIELPSYIKTDAKDKIFPFSLKKTNSDISHFDIQITSEIQQQKYLQKIDYFPIKHPNIYYSNFSQKNEKLVSILTCSSLFFSFSDALTSNGYSTSNIFDPYAEFVISLLPFNEINFNQINSSQIESILPNKIPLYVYTQSPHSTIFSNIDTFFFTQICKFLFYSFFVVLSIRIQFYFSKIKIPTDSYGYIFFSDYHGKAYIFYPFQLLKFSKQYKELLKRVKKTKGNDNIILEYYHTPTAFKVHRLHAYYITDNLCFLLYFEEIFQENPDNSTTRIENTTLYTNETNTPSEVTIDIHFRSNEYTTAELHFSIDEVPCKITVKPNNPHYFPFGGQILLVSYLDCIHIGALNEGARLDSSIESFINFLDFLRQRMDFKGLAIFVDDGNGKVPVCEFYDSDEIKEMTMLCLDKIPVKTISDMEVESYQNTKYSVSGNSFQVASHSYYITVALDAKKFIFRSSERRFLFILSILVSFHHSFISSKGENRILSRIYKLLERTECFAIIECISTPTRFYSSHGKIFNEVPTQETLDLISSQTDLSKSSTKMTVPLKHPKLGNVWITIASTSYCDTTLQETIYMYLIEDVTSFHERTIQLNAAHESGEMVNRFLGLHKINNDFSISPNSSFASELGYSHSISNISDIIFKEDLSKFKDIKTPNKVFKFRAKSALGHPVWFSAVQTGANGNFIVFSSREFSQIHAISQNSYVRLKNCNKSGTFMLATIELDFGTIEMLVTTDKVLNQQTKSLKVDEFMSLIMPEDLNLFTTTVDEIRTGKLYEKYLVLRAKLNGSKYEAFIMYLISCNEKRIILFTNYVDKKYKRKKALLKLNTELDFAFQNTKMIKFVFEDLHTPERIFVTEPLFRNQMIFNWTTLEKNVKKDHIEQTRVALTRCLTEKVEYNILVPMVYETIKWYLYRGRVIENTHHITGNAVDLSTLVSQNEAEKKALVDSEKNIIEENNALKHTKEILDFIIQYLISAFQVYSITIDDKDSMEMIEVLIDSLQKLLECDKTIPYSF